MRKTNKKSFSIDYEHNHIVYKALVEYWSKDYKVLLIDPENKTIDTAHMPYMAPLRFARKGETSHSFIDIEEIAMNCLLSYVSKLNQE